MPSDETQALLLASFDSFQQSPGESSEKLRSAFWTLAAALGDASWVMVSSVLRAFCEAAVESSVASQGLFYGISVPMAVVYVIRTAYQLWNREDIGPNKSWHSS